VGNNKQGFFITKISPTADIISNLKRLKLRLQILKPLKVKSFQYVVNINAFLNLLVVFYFTMAMNTYLNVNNDLAMTESKSCTIH
jgi:hypothetical protein